MIEGASTDYERALALETHLREEFRFTADTSLRHDLDDLEDFLFEARKGSSEQFAAAFAVLARSVGLPTRVAVGFTTGEWDASREEYNRPG